ncbi:MAG: hypothetical protein KBA66_06435 [Leptospiraceae bacterium]|nr:hypothetical protein [Leptospiraceae bacterium]
MVRKSLIDIIFDWCVEILIYWAKVFGISYNEINVYIFCIIWPILTLFLIGIIIYQQLEILKLKAKFKK